MRYAAGPLSEKRYGLVTGTFDRLDEASERRLRAAKSGCDRLIVGLAVEPEATFAARKRALEEHELVDDLFIYHDERELEEAIEALRPHRHLDRLLAA